MARHSTDHDHVGDVDIGQVETHTAFSRERSRVHEVFICERAKNERLGLVLSFLLILAATSAVLFAPQGRETMSYWLGAALLVFAGGASGFGHVWAKTPGFSFGAGSSSDDAAIRPGPRKRQAKGRLVANKIPSLLRTSSQIRGLRGARGK